MINPPQEQKRDGNQANETRIDTLAKRNGGCVKNRSLIPPQLLVTVEKTQFLRMFVQV
jgi:hypothetical protein